MTTMLVTKKMLWIFPFNNLAFYYRNKYDLALNV